VQEEPRRLESGARGSRRTERGPRPTRLGRRKPSILFGAWLVLVPLSLFVVPAVFRWVKQLAGDANVAAAAGAAFVVTLAFSVTLYWFTRRYVIAARRTP